LGRERGSDLVEFSLVAIVVMMVLFGIGDFGYALYAYHFVSGAARDATRWAAVNGSTCNQDATATNPTDLNDPGSCTAPVTCIGTSCSVCTSYGSCTSATATDIQNYVTMITPSGINPRNVTTTVTWPVNSDSPTICSSAVSGVGPTDNAPGCTVEVQVSYTFGSLLPLVHVGPITMTDPAALNPQGTGARIAAARIAAPHRRDRCAARF
jgi:Flp pilus assembly protein TadG